MLEGPSILSALFAICAKRRIICITFIPIPRPSRELFALLLLLSLGQACLEPLLHHCEEAHQEKTKLSIHTTVFILAMLFLARKLTSALGPLQESSSCSMA